MTTEEIAKVIAILPREDDAADELGEEPRLYPLERDPAPAAAPPPPRKAKAKGKSGKAEQAAPPTLFDPKAVAEGLNIWWQKGKDLYLRPAPAGDDWLPESGRAIARLLRIKGVHTKKGEDSTHSQADEVFQYVHDYRHVTFAGPLAGKLAGVLEIDDGRPIIVTSSYRYIEPAAGDWPLHRAFLEGLLQTAEADQTPLLFSWLKVARAALLAGVARPAPWLVLAGPPNCGKSFIQSAVLTPMLGGRCADPRDWMFDRTQHNAEIIGAEHVMMEEMPSGLDHESRSQLGEKMKQIAVNHWHRWRGMHQDGFMLPVFWRASLSINDNADKLKTLPSLSTDFANKIMLLACELKAMPMPTESDDDMIAFGRALAAERPAFAHFLDKEFEVPEDLRQTKDASRFGFDVFHHPRLVANLFEQEMESGLLYMIDAELFGGGSGLRGCDGEKFTAPWGWEASENLAELLRASQRFGPQARKLLSFNNACGTYLQKLADKFTSPKRFEKKHTNRGNLWLIHPPAG